MKTFINIYGIVGFGLASVFAVIDEWSLPEFCWSAWLTGLIYVWACVAASVVKIILTGKVDRGTYEERLPLLRNISSGAYTLGLMVVGVLVGFLAFQIYSYLFGFYGLFLSVFAEMEPLSLFGRNGFINSDFYTPVSYLVVHFWPMAVGALIANWEDFILHESSWRGIFLPFHREILRMHILTLALPFFSLIAWALFRDAYQPATIVLLMGILYLLPRKTLRNNRPGQSTDAADPA